MRQVVIVGAGPAGIAAAVRTAEAGADVRVLDDNATPGGQIWRQGAAGGRGGTGEAEWLRRFHRCGARTDHGTRVVGAGARDKTLLAEKDGAALDIPYSRLILATGARELLLPFPGWTLPGVMGVGGLQALANSGLPVRRKRIAIAGTGPLLLAAAAYFRHRGADVVVLAEQARTASLAAFVWALSKEAGKLRQAASLQWKLLGVPYLHGCMVVRAEGTGKVERILLRHGNRVVVEEIDYAAIAFGLTSNTELAQALGCKIAGEGVAVDRFQRTSAQDIYCAGESTGIGGVDAALTQGEIAGLSAAGDDAGARSLFLRRDKSARFAQALGRAFALREEIKQIPDPETIVCRCEDVRYGQLLEHTSARSAKLQTRFGMGPCQGRVCGAAARFLFGWEAGAIRPPVLPCRVGTLSEWNGAE